MSKPKISIVIPLRRTKYLYQLLNAISKMDDMDSDVEIVLSENPKKTTESKSIIKKFDMYNMNIQHVMAGSGSNVARNVGIGFASSDKIALLDDDCIPEQRWLSSLLSVYTLHPNIGIFGGPCRPNFKCERPRWLDGYLLDILGRLDYGPDIKDLPHGDEMDAFLLSANLSFKKSVWKDVGRFKQDIGQQNGHNPRGSCTDEILFINKCADPRYRPSRLYIGSMVVWHQIDKDRANIYYLVDKAYGHGVGVAESILNSPRLQDSTIEDIYHDFIVRQWNSLLSLQDISTIRSYLSHEESLRLYIKYVIQCRTAFMQGVNDTLCSSSKTSYEEMMNDGNKLYFIGPRLKDQYK